MDIQSRKQPSKLSEESVGKLDITFTNHNTGSEKYETQPDYQSSEQQLKLRSQEKPPI